MSWVDVTTAIGTAAAAAVIALGLGSRAEWRAFRTEQEARASQRAVQASQVAGWMSSPLIREHSDAYPEIHIRVRNGSDTPIYMVWIKVMAGVRGTFIRYVDAMGPGETREFTIVLPSYPRANIFAPELLFTDINSKRWLRGNRGELRELRENEHPDFKEDPGTYNEVGKTPNASSTYGRI